MVQRHTASNQRLTPGTTRRRFSLRFIGEAFSELKRVTWPTRQETMRLTLMVIYVATAVGLLLFVVDLVFSQVFNVLLGS